uniref:CCHC-type domain-containing protein n=1 Tax=Timema tahoe TaxID=61484 RepID=A0A7R9NYW7_9NEOP|nr:unnamed protein product [Timema tahoe]
MKHVRALERVSKKAAVQSLLPSVVSTSSKSSHPRFELPATDIQQKDGKKLVITCHYCGESGHKALYCNKMPAEIREVQNKQDEFRPRTRATTTTPIADFLGNSFSTVPKPLPFPPYSLVYLPSLLVKKRVYNGKLLGSQIVVHHLDIFEEGNSAPAPVEDNC